MRISDWSSDVCSSDLAAVLIFLQLRSVLGRRTGNEKPPADPFSAREAAKAPASDDGKVVTLPRRDGSDEDRLADIDNFAKPEIGRASCREECVSTCRSRWWTYH